MTVQNNQIHWNSLDFKIDHSEFKFSFSVVHVWWSLCDGLIFCLPNCVEFLFFSQNQLLSQDEKEKHYISFNR